MQFISGHLGAAVSLIDLSFTQFVASSAAAASYTQPAAPLGAAHANRRIILPITAMTTVSTRTITSVTVGGVAATAVTSLISETAAGITQYARMYIASVPTGTTGDIVIVFNATVSGIGYMNYRMVNSTATAHDTGTDTGSNPATTLDIPANGGAVAMTGHNGDAAANTWAGLTENIDSTYDAAQDGRITDAKDIFASLQTNLAISCTTPGSTMACLVTASWPA